MHARARDYRAQRTDYWNIATTDHNPSLAPHTTHDRQNRNHDTLSTPACHLLSSPNANSKQKSGGIRYLITHDPICGDHVLPIANRVFLISSSSCFWNNLFLLPFFFHLLFFFQFFFPRFLAIGVWTIGRGFSCTCGDGRMALLGVAFSGGFLWMGVSKYLRTAARRCSGRVRKWVDEKSIQATCPLLPSGGSFTADLPIYPRGRRKGKRILNLSYRFAARGCVEVMQQWIYWRSGPGY